MVSLIEESLNRHEQVGRPKNVAGGILGRTEMADLAAHEQTAVESLRCDEPADAPYPIPETEPRTGYEARKRQFEEDDEEEDDEESVGWDEEDDFGAYDDDFDNDDAFDDEYDDADDLDEDEDEEY